MAAGEYVSVSSQSDSEEADLSRERRELERDPAAEREELAAIYIGHGLDRELALKVACQLVAKDPLYAHARDELGISEFTTARLIQAALISAATFSAGAAMPLLVAAVSPTNLVVYLVSAASLLFLAVLGALGARVGGAPVLRATARVAFWRALAMAVTAGIGHLVGKAI